MKKIIYAVVAVAVLVGSGAFYGGMKYAQGQSGRGNFANLTPEQRQQLTANAGAGFRGGAGQGRGGLNGGFTIGEILSKDDTSITIKMQDGGSKIVLYSTITEVSKFTEGSVGDLIVGKNVSVTGTANQDGSITAQSIQLRPNLPTPTPNK
jgi:hypothetical protein